jgi:glycosyltransferase involved in cell wall biosynthesis
VTRGVLRLAVYSDAMSVGGAEIAAGHLLAELDDAIEVVVVGVEPGVLGAIASPRPGTPQRIVPRVRNKADVRAIAAHVRAIRAVRPDVLQVALYSPWAGQYGILAGVINATAVVAVENAAFASTSALQRRLRRALCSRLSAHVTVGKRSALQLEHLLGLSRGSLEVIYNGVPDIPLTPAPRSQTGAAVGTLARFDRAKGLDVLIRALPALPDVTCVLVGDGPESASLELLADELGVSDRVTMTGWVDRARDYLAALDLVVVPSRFEGLPLVVVEAMLAERVVVASDVGSICEAIEHERTGMLVPPEDPAALSAVISSLLADAELRREMGARARERALERFTSVAMARSYESLYRRLARDRPAPRRPRNRAPRGSTVGRRSRRRGR